MEPGGFPGFRRICLVFSLSSESLILLYFSSISSIADGMFPNRGGMVGGERDATVARPGFEPDLMAREADPPVGKSVEKVFRPWGHRTVFPRRSQAPRGPWTGQVVEERSFSWRAVNVWEDVRILMRGRGRMRPCRDRCPPRWRLFHLVHPVFRGDGPTRDKGGPQCGVRSPGSGGPVQCGRERGRAVGAFNALPGVAT